MQVLAEVSSPKAEQYTSLAASFPLLTPLGKAHDAKETHAEEHENQQHFEWPFGGRRHPLMNRGENSKGKASARARNMCGSEHSSRRTLKIAYGVPRASAGLR